MSRPFVEDVIAVLEEIGQHFQSGGSETAMPILRKEAIQAVAQKEVDAQRFSTDESAENSIHDACVRRLGFAEVAEFDERVSEWLQGRSESLKRALDDKVTTESVRQKVAALLQTTYFQPTTPQA